MPTSGNARFDSGLSVLDFLKRTSYIEASKKGLHKVIKPIEIIGNSEGLDAHVKSALIRFSISPEFIISRLIESSHKD